MNDQTTNNSGASEAPSQQPDNTQNANAPANGREAAQRPIRTIRDGAISASLWEREGEEGPQYSAKVVRKWRDEEGKFHESNNYSEYDLSRLADVARNTSDVIDGMRQGRQQSRNTAQDKNQSRDTYIDERQGQSQKQSLQNTRTRNDW